MELWWREGECGGDGGHVCRVCDARGLAGRGTPSNEGVGLCWPDNALLSVRSTHRVSGVV